MSDQRTKPGRFLGETYEPGRLCAHCNYDLGGVPVGNVCPECGKAAGRAGRRGRSGRIVESLMDAPMWYLKSLALGTTLLCGVLFAVMLLGLFGTVLLRRSYGDLPPAGLKLMLAIVWWVGVYIATSPRALTNPGSFNAKAEWRRLRVVNRVTQAFWAIGASLGLMHAAVTANMLPGGPTPNGALLISIAWAIATLIGMFGLVPLCIQLGDLAEWAQDSPLNARFNTAGGSIAFGGVINIVLELTTRINPLWFLFKFLSLMALLLLVFGVVLFFANIFNFATMIHWAIRNKEKLHEVDERRMERDLREAERLREQQDRIDEANRRMGTSGVEATMTTNDTVALVDAPADTGGNAKGKRTIRPEITPRDRSITAPRNYATGSENRPRGEGAM